MRTAAKVGLAALVLALAGGAAFTRFVLYPESATLDFASGTGPNPTLLRIEATLGVSYPTPSS